MNPSRARRVVYAGLPFVFFGLSLVYIARTFELDGIRRNLSAADPRVFVIGVTATVVVYWLIRTVRWRMLLANLGVRVGFADLYLASAFSLSLALLTPLQAGEIAKVEVLRGRLGLSRMAGYSTLVVERAMDGLGVVGLAVVGLPWIPGFTPEAPVVLLAAGVGLLLVLAASVLVWVVDTGGWLGSLQRHVRACVSGPTEMAICLGLTLAGWLAVAAGWYACLLAVEVHLSFGKVVALTAVVTLVNIVSLVPGAIGVSEATASAILVQLAVPEPLAQAGALALRGLGLWILALGLLHYWVLRRRRDEPGREDR